MSICFQQSDSCSPLFQQNQCSQRSVTATSTETSAATGRKLWPINSKNRVSKRPFSVHSLQGYYMGIKSSPEVSSSKQTGLMFLASNKLNDEVLRKINVSLTLLCGRRTSATNSHMLVRKGPARFRSKSH